MSTISIVDASQKASLRPGFYWVEMSFDRPAAPEVLLRALRAIGFDSVGLELEEPGAAKIGALSMSASVGPSARYAVAAPSATTATSTASPAPAPSSLATSASATSYASAVPAPRPTTAPAVAPSYQAPASSPLPRPSVSNVTQASAPRAATAKATSTANYYREPPRITIPRRPNEDGDGGGGGYAPPPAPDPPFIDPSTGKPAVDPATGHPILVEAGTGKLYDAVTNYYVEQEEQESGGGEGGGGLRGGEIDERDVAPDARFAPRKTSASLDLPSRLNAAPPVPGCVRVNPLNGQAAMWLCPPGTDPRSVSVGSRSLVGGAAPEDEARYTYRFMGQLGQAIDVTSKPGLRWTILHTVGFDPWGPMTFRLVPHELKQGQLYDLRFLSRDKTAKSKKDVLELLRVMGFSPATIFLSKRNMRIPGRPLTTLSEWFGVGLWTGPDSVIVSGDPFYFAEVRPTS